MTTTDPHKCPCGETDDVQVREYRAPGGYRFKGRLCRRRFVELGWRPLERLDPHK